MEKEFGKQRFCLLKRHLEQNWWALNTPVVAGRLVLSFLQDRLNSEGIHSLAPSDTINPGFAKRDKYA